LIITLLSLVHLAVDARQRAQMFREDHSDHGRSPRGKISTSESWRRSRIMKRIMSKSTTKTRSHFAGLSLS
jgi:hypothetical protein